MPDKQPETSLNSDQSSGFRVTQCAGGYVDVAPRRICECCEREQGRDEIDWAVSREGDDFCGDCWRDLTAEGERLRDALPKRIALCPQCAPEFYYPLKDGEGLTCPMAGCGMTMVVYNQEAR